MMYSLEGTPGVGKSLYCVQHIIPSFLKIRDFDGSLKPVHIWHNIEGLKPWAILALCGLPESVETYFHHIGEYTDHIGNKRIDKRYQQYFYFDPATIEWVQGKDEKGKVIFYPDEEKAQYLPINSLVILDEVQNIFGSRNFAEKYSKDCIAFLTRHRHYGCTIFWASQNIEQVDVSFRRNTDCVYFLESLANFALVGGKDKFKISKYEGWQAGNKLGITPFAVETEKKDKRFFNCYSSFVSKDVKEVRFISNMWTHSKPIKIVVALILLCLVISFFAGNPLKAISGKKQPNPPTQHPSPQSSGLAPVLGAVGVDSSIVCITNSFVNNGVPYVVVNGQNVKVKSGVKYEYCSNNQ